MGSRPGKSGQVLPPFWGTILFALRTLLVILDSCIIHVVAWFATAVFKSMIKTEPMSDPVNEHMFIHGVDPVLVIVAVVLGSDQTAALEKLIAGWVWKRQLALPTWYEIRADIDIQVAIAAFLKCSSHIRLGTGTTGTTTRKGPGFINDPISLDQFEINIMRCKSIIDDAYFSFDDIILLTHMNLADTLAMVTKVGTHADVSFFNSIVGSNHVDVGIDRNRLPVCLRLSEPFLARPFVALPRDGPHSSSWA